MCFILSYDAVRLKCRSERITVAHQDACSYAQFSSKLQSAVARHMVCFGAAIPLQKWGRRSL